MSDATIQEMHRVLEMQKALNISEGAPDIKLRKDRLDRVIAMVNKYQDQIVQSVNDDFGNRDPVMSAVTEVASVIGPMEHAKKNLKSWMKTENTRSAFSATQVRLSSEFWGGPSPFFCLLLSTFVYSTLKILHESRQK